MKLRLLILLFLSALVCNSVTFAQDSAPYFYYYSADEQSIVVELADGSDRRGFSIGSHEPVFGPGFSPDGKWFASYDFENQFGSGSVVSVDGTTVLGPLENLKNFNGMYWSPDSRHILVIGSFDECRALTCLYQTYWLIDVQMDRIVATADTSFTPGSPMERFMEWSDDGEIVSFYTQEDNRGYLIGTNTYFVTMGTDGTVTKRNVSWDEYHTTNPHSSDSILYWPDIELVSSNGRYSISAYHEVTDHLTGLVTNLPIPRFYLTQDYVGNTVEAQWHESSEWVLIGYNIWSGGIDGVSIARADGSHYRPLNTCGFGPACVGWLPSNVDVESILLLVDAP